MTVSDVAPTRAWVDDERTIRRTPLRPGGGLDTAAERRLIARWIWIVAAHATIVALRTVNSCSCCDGPARRAPRNTRYAQGSRRPTPPCFSLARVTVHARLNSACFSTAPATSHSVDFLVSTHVP